MNVAERRERKPMSNPDVTENQSPPATSVPASGSAHCESCNDGRWIAAGPNTYCSKCGRTGGGAEAFPLRLTIRLTATNGSTLLAGIEDVCKEFHAMRIPKLGQVFDGKFWRAEIMECVERLPNAELSDRRANNP